MTTENSAPDTGEEVQGWRPEPGDVIQGHIADLDIATSTQRNSRGEYPQYPIVKIKQEDGTLTWVHCFHQTLQRELLSRRPEIGVRIRIKFIGKKPLKSDSSRSVAIYAMDLPDTPKQAKNIYDQLGQTPRSQPAPAAPDVDTDLPTGHVESPGDDWDF